MGSQIVTNNLVDLSLNWKENCKTVWSGKYEKEAYQWTNGNGDEMGRSLQCMLVSTIGYLQQKMH